MRADNSVSQDIKEVLSRWFQDISGLFSGIQENPDMIFDDDLYREIVSKKEEFERLYAEEPIRISQSNSEVINSVISYDEIADAINKSKMKKAYLEIPNEALKK